MCSSSASAPGATRCWRTALSALGESARCELCRTRRSSARLPAGACTRARKMSRGGSEYGASFGRWSASSARRRLRRFASAAAAARAATRRHVPGARQDGPGDARHASRRSRARRGDAAARRRPRPRRPPRARRIERSPPSHCIGAAACASVTLSGDQDGRAERDDARHPADVGVVDADAAVRADEPSGSARLAPSRPWIATRPGPPP